MCTKKKTTQTGLWLFAHASKMDASKEKIRHVLQFFFDKDEKASLKLWIVIKVLIDQFLKLSIKVWKPSSPTVQRTVWNDLNKVGYKRSWVPYELTQKNVYRICESLLNHNKIDKFLSDSQQAVARRDSQQGFSMYLVGLARNNLRQILNSVLSCQQLDRLKETIAK